MNEGKLIVISGPSGCGKGTIIKELLRIDKNLKLSVSMTTRKPRAGETDGVEYFFVTNDVFREKILCGDLIEYTQYSGNFYGTPRSEVSQMQKKGYDVLLDIEVEGAENVRKKKMDNLTTIFLIPPDFEELRKRLEGRGTENAEAVAMRMKRAQEEMKYKDKYDYIVVNDSLECAVKEIYNIIKK